MAEFTAENATDAPKLIIDASMAKSITAPSNDTTETTRIAHTV
jgi:hypothetical protein